ncbi:MAG: hypothetical protein GXO18_06755 [Aquificae bacterium]|nr:hypothetical protein [Aquificota bacterium]
MKEDSDFILWSGGKDSYLAYKKATLRGYQIRYALSYIEKRTKRLIGCHIRETAIRKQTQALGLEFIPIYGSKRKGNFLQNLFQTLKDLKPRAGIMGDLYRTEHRNSLESLCKKLNIRPVFPLWGMDEGVLLSQILQISDPIIVCRRVRIIPRRFLKRPLRGDFIKFLKENNLSLSGEGGEYQTFVSECEDFKLTLKVERTFRKSYYECIDFEVE